MYVCACESTLSYMFVPSLSAFIIPFCPDTESQVASIEEALDCIYKTLMRELLWCLICNTIKCMSVHSHKQTKTNSASQWGGLLKTFLRTLKTLLSRLLSAGGFSVFSWGFLFGSNTCLQLHPCESKDSRACGVFGEQKRVSDPVMWE